MVASGRILDKQSGGALSGATVTITNAAGQPLPGLVTTSNNVGYFYISGNFTTNDFLVITHVSYLPIKAAVIPANDYGFIKMDRKEIELPPVVVTNPTGSKNSWLLLAIGGAALAAASKKKRTTVNGIKTSDVMTAGAVVALVLGVDTIKKIFEGLGFWNSKEDKEVQDEISDPNSPFNPAFYHNAPSGSLLMTQQQLINLGNILLAAFGAFSDDEALAMSVFKNFRTQSQVAQFSDAWQKTIGGEMWVKYGGGDLLSWLRGSGWPDDRLSNAEISEIITYVNKLPKYRP